MGEVALLIGVILGYIVIPVLYRVFKNPSEAFLPGKKRKTVVRIALAYLLLALLPLVSNEKGFSALYITYPLLYAVLFRKQIRSFLGSHSQKVWVFFITAWLILWFDEIFAFLDMPTSGPFLVHMLSYGGYYLGYVLTMVLFRKYAYSFAQVFTIGGLQGLLIEQQLAGVMLLLSGAIFNFLALAPMAFLGHGMILAGPYLLFYEEYKDNKRPPLWRSALFFIALSIIPLVTWFLWGETLKVLGISYEIPVV